MILDSTLDEKGIPTRYLILLMIFVVTAVNYGDRATLSIAGTEVSERAGAQRGVDGIQFFRLRLGLSADAIPGGWLLDKFGSKRFIHTVCFLVTVYLPARLY